MVLLHVLGLWALAVAQPLLDLLGANPEFFVAHRAGALEILGLTLLLAAGLPLLVAALVRLVGLAGARAREAARDVVLATLAWAFAMQVAIRAGAASWPIAVPIAAAVAVAVVLAYRRWTAVRSFFTILSIAALVVPALFLLKPGIRTLVAAPANAGEGGRAPAATGGTAARAPVVLIVFDELPLLSLLDADRNIDPVLYPNFAALARDGVWYRNATTVHAFTRWAVPSIVSGKYPREAALPSAADHPDTLFTLLGATHRLEVSEALTSLCPERLCPPGEENSRARRLAAMGRDLRVVFLHLVLTRDLTASLPDPTQTWADFGGGGAAPDAAAADIQPEADENGVRAAVRERWREGITASRVPPVQRFIDGIGNDDPQPTFYFLHTLVSHHPHVLLPSGKQNRTWVRLPEERDKGQSWAIVQAYQRHLLQVGFVDGLIGQLVRRLKEAGIYDDAMIVITADHGASYLPGQPLRNFRDETAAEIMRVPLIMKFPARVPLSAHVSDANAETVDILPTVADALGIAVPWQVDGSSLIDPARPERPSKFMFTTGRRHELPAAGPDLEPALRRKVELFGDGARNPERAPRVPAFDRLIGQPLAALHVVEGGGPVEITQAWEYEDVDLSGSAVVFDVAGRFASPRPDTFVAVAVDGVVQAVTRTWESNPRGWLATPKFGAWRPGRNAIEVFVLEGGEAAPLLRRTSLGQVRPEGLNLVLAAAADEWGVRQWGFYQLERGRGGKRFRWTRARAELSNLYTYKRPREVEVEVLMVPSRAPKELKIEANDCVLFQGPVSDGWSSTLSLAPCGIARDLTLRFTTSAARAGRDPRRLGVALSGVVLR
ncbi:MAG: sulfatase [Acidobacteria bacterium]|nr:sulfatase [Acidobacteriota bacterium]